MSSLYDITGIVPESSDSETSTGPDGFDVSNSSVPAELSMSRTLVPRHSSTPKRDSKVMSLSINLSLACSPAYIDREYIAKEDRANVTFCLENSDDPLSSSVPGESNSVPSGLQSDNQLFEISSYITMLNIASENRKSFSTTDLNKLGSPIRKSGSTQSFGHGLGTPETKIN